MDVANCYTVSNVTVILNAQLTASSIRWERSQVRAGPVQLHHEIHPWGGGQEIGKTHQLEELLQRLTAGTNDVMLKDSEEKVFFQVYVNVWDSCTTQMKAVLSFQIQLWWLQRRKPHEKKSNLAFWHAFDIFCLFLELGEQEAGIFSDTLTRLKMA